LVRNGHLMALLLLRLIASYIIKFFGEEYPSRVDGLTIAPICQGLGSLPEGGKGKKRRFKWAFSPKSWRKTASRIGVCSENSRGFVLS
jgi:hypothetical protein